MKTDPFGTLFPIYLPNISLEFIFVKFFNIKTPGVSAMAETDANIPFFGIFAVPLWNFAGNGLYCRRKEI